MKPAPLLALAAAFAAGAFFALAASEAAARPAPATAPAVYTNDVFGFSIAPPAFPKAEKTGGGQAAMFFGPPRNGFANNLNVIVQTGKMTVDEYVEASKEQFAQMEFKSLSESRLKVSGRPAALFEYEGKLQGRDLKWMAMAVVDGERIFLVTGTSAAADYAALSKEFKASLESFKIAE